MDLNVFTEIALEKLLTYIKEENYDSKNHNGDPGRKADRAAGTAEQ